MASQEAIKELGTNGGGFVNANSAHPYENPTALSNFLEMLAIILIPASLTYTFGRMVGDTRQGWAVLAAMTILFVALLAIAVHSEQQGNPLVAKLGVDQAASALQPGGNMEGKEARFGIGASALFATITTGTSCGAVNSMHDSFTPLGGFVPLFNMQLGEVVFGGVGTGLYSMLIFAIIGVFIAGLMIGRTPEYLGKKIEAFEMKMSSIAILVMPFIVLVGTAVAVSLTAGQAAVANPGRARVFGDPLRLHFRQQQQWQRIRRAVGKHALLQHGARARDVARPVLADRGGARDRRLARRQEARAGHRRHDAHLWANLRHPAHRHGAARRRAHLRASARARTDR